VNLLISDIIWIFTAKCGLNCPHCYVKPRFSKLRELSSSEKIRLVREAAEMNVEWIGLSGGEPLIHPDFKAIVREASEHNMEVSVVTSGIMYMKELLDVIRRHNVYVTVSLDGATIKSHELVRGKDAWKKTVGFIEKLRLMSIEFSTVIAVNRFNYLEAGEYVELSMELGSRCACLIPTMKTGSAVSTGMYVTAPKYLEAIKKAEEKADELGFPVSLWCSPFAGLYVHSPYVKYGNCRFWDNVDIDPAGRILLCDTIDIVLAEYRGNLAEAVKESLRNPINKLVEEVEDDICLKCRNYRFCRGGCFARAYMEYGDLRRPDPLCPVVFYSKRNYYIKKK